jgi:hypothetical protein
MKKMQVVGAFCGTGKTYLANKYPDIVLDLDIGTYKFIDDVGDEIPFEQRKAIKQYQINPDWPQNYIEAILKNRPLYDIVFVSYCPEIAHLLDFYFYPTLSEDGWQVLEQRFRARGNNQRFIDIAHAQFTQLKNIPPGNFKTIRLYTTEYLETPLKRGGLL